MNYSLLLLALAFLLPIHGSPNSAASQPASATTADVPNYTADGQLIFPANYREWIFLTSGVDMSYNPRFNSSGMGHSMFDNVFVNPSAYKAFLQTGTWPDKTMLVLEGRVAGTKASINKSGQYQTGEVMGTEVHVKDERLPGKWAFYSFDDPSMKPSKPFPHEMDCYSCHEQHGAVDTTFVQFYPTLIKLAEQKGTLSTAYKADEAKK
jgi:Cytochrome P460